MTKTLYVHINKRNFFKLSYLQNVPEQINNVLKWLMDAAAQARSIYLLIGIQKGFPLEPRFVPSHRAGTVLSSSP
jgi:hypothetical protein